MIKLKNYLIFFFYCTNIFYEMFHNFFRLHPFPQKNFYKNPLHNQEKKLFLAFLFVKIFRTLGENTINKIL